MYMLSPPLRDLEEKGNLLFSEYAKLYYGEEDCISNFYVFETEDGLNFAFYLKKSTCLIMQSTRKLSASESGILRILWRSGEILPKVPATRCKPQYSMNTTFWTRRPRSSSKSTVPQRKTYLIFFSASGIQTMALERI
jgi:hypothetical protein